MAAVHRGLGEALEIALSAAELIRTGARPGAFLDYYFKKSELDQYILNRNPKGFKISVEMKHLNTGVIVPKIVIIGMYRVGPRTHDVSEWHVVWSNRSRYTLKSEEVISINHRHLTAELQTYVNNFHTRFFPPRR